MSAMFTQLETFLNWPLQIIMLIEKGEQFKIFEPTNISHKL